jgi:hypothetical protein
VRRNSFAGSGASKAAKRTAVLASLTMLGQ